MLRPASFGAVMAAALAFAGIASAQQLGYNFNFTLPIVADTQSYHSTIYLHTPTWIRSMCRSHTSAQRAARLPERVAGGAPVLFVASCTVQNNTSFDADFRIAKFHF